MYSYQYGFFNFADSFVQGSLMLLDEASEQSDAKSLTPAKRSGTLIANLEESFDQNSITKTTTLVKIKKEKIEKSG